MCFLFFNPSHRNWPVAAVIASSHSPPASRTTPSDGAARSRQMWRPFTRKCVTRKLSSLCPLTRAYHRLLKLQINKCMKGQLCI